MENIHMKLNRKITKSQYLIKTNEILLIFNKLKQLDEKEGKIIK